MKGKSNSIKHYILKEILEYIICQYNSKRGMYLADNFIHLKSVNNKENI